MTCIRQYSSTWPLRQRYYGIAWHYTIGYYKSITYIPPREALSFSSRCCILPACYQHHVQQQGPKIKKAFGRRSCDITGPPSRYIKIIKEKNKIAEAVRRLNYIYIYTYIVLNTHTYTRMCIYIYISLSLSARVWMSSTQPFPEPTPLATHFHKTSLESNVLQMLGSSSLRSAQENMGKPSKKMVDFPLLFGWLSESIRGYVNWIPLGWLSHLWTTAPCYTTTQLNNVAPACGSAIHFPVRQEALRINRRQGAEFHLLGRSLGVKCCLI